MLPVHFQFHGPLPDKFDVIPEEHRLMVGTIVNVPPLLLPQTPFTFRFARHVASLPPLLPKQVQLQGPVPVTFDVAPDEQRFVDGALIKLLPFAKPQFPLTCRVATQFSEVPESIP